MDYPVKPDNDHVEGLPDGYSRFGGSSSSRKVHAALRLRSPTIDSKSGNDREGKRTMTEKKHKSGNDRKIGNIL